MDSDISSPESACPPVAWSTARSVGLVGFGLILAAATAAVASTWSETPSAFQTVRLFLVALGAVTAGGAVALRSDRWEAWAIGGLTALLATFATPSSWDSFRLLFEVLSGVALIGTLINLMTGPWRVVAVSALIVFHFIGISLASLSPGTGGLPAPWVVEQGFSRIYNPYLQFVYLRNAYHFYSPEPGPASLLAFLIKTDTGKVDASGRKEFTYKWLVVPRRPADVKDPLGLTFYRRLSLTDQAAHGMPGSASNSERFEKRDVELRRQQATVDPLPGEAETTPTPVPISMPGEPPNFSYLIPDPVITRFVIPSYAQHVIMDQVNGDDARRRTTVKVYRIEHRTPTVLEFIGEGNPYRKPNEPRVGRSPYHPTTYRPFFLGEYDVYGKLVDPREPLLYWLLPVTPNPGPADNNRKDYTDYFSRHAGYPFEWNRLR